MVVKETFKKSMRDIASIAVTGVSGRFPNCTNVAELQEALFNGEDLITENHNRWAHEVLGTSPRLGLINDFEYFDASFFGINPKDANVYNPKLRKFIEVTFEAIVDAGLNPSELRGSQVGVFLAIGPNEVTDVDCKGGIMIQNPGIMANIVSYTFDFKGPSVAMNTACSSSFYALAQAIDSILAGRCHTAIVGGVQHQYDPAESIELQKLGISHKEGVCRVFDKNRKGYVKSEAVVAVVLQKVENSKRIYATIAGIDVNAEGFGKKGFGHPSHLLQKQMYENVHENFDIDPLDVTYFEAHGTGTIVGDAEEIQSIDEFYTKGRIHPLLIGSVKSNLGHAEAAAGLVSLVKVIIAIHRGIIPANLHFHTPDPELKGIYEGRLKVVNYNTPLPKGLIAINCFGFGGANSILILNPYVAKKTVSNKPDHRLVQVSGRTSEGVKLMIENVLKNKENKDFLCLVDAVYSKPIKNHGYRGYVVFSKDSHYEIAKSLPNKRPIWYIYAGFGSQWPRMAKDLMKIKVFQNTIQKCAEAIKSYGIDLVDVLVNGNEETFDDMTKTYPAITAVSVALTDTLTSLNIAPDGIIGHSLGEVGCAYADGLITPEQAVLLSFARGYAIMNSPLISGAMAVVGLSIEECNAILPKDVYVACDNSNRNVTISGPKQIVTKFLHQLNNQGIYNKLINNANYALHCPHLAPASKIMLSITRNVLSKPKIRTQKWLSTAYDESEWNSERAKWNSAEYHYDNYVNQVRFRQVLKYIPKDAIVIEIAPKGIFQGLLKKELDPTVTVLSLLKSNVDNSNFLLSNIGKIFNCGGSVDLQNFYKPVNFPVSVDTPIISSLVKWDHSIKWHSFKYNPEGFFGIRVEIDISNRKFEYLEGHVANGKIIIPAATYLVLVWETFAKIVNTPYRKLPVCFENIKIHTPIFLKRDSPITLVVNIFKITGQFSISVANCDQLIVTGNIRISKDVPKQLINCQNPTISNQKSSIISCDEFYDSMNLRGINYSGIFRCIKQCSIHETSAIVQWNDNWVALLDAMCQYILHVETSDYCFPSIFEKIHINPLEHLKYIKSSSDLLLTYDNILNSAKVGGIEIKKIHATKVKKHCVETPPLLRKYTFIPNHENRDEDLAYSLTVASQILIENCTENLNIKIGEIGSGECLKILKSSIEKVNLKKTQFQLINSREEISNFDLLIIREKDNVSEYLNRSRFIFAPICNDFNSDNFEVIYRLDTKSKSFVLFRKSTKLPDSYKVIVANNNNYDWVLELQTAVKEYQSRNSRIYLINDDINSGIVGLFNTIRHERYCPNLRVFLIRNCKKLFSLDSEFYKNQIKKDLTINVCQNDTWGTYRLLPLEPQNKELLNDAVLFKDNNSIKWVQNFSHATNDPVSTRFASLNTNDLLIIREKSGYYKENEHLGLEYSGVDINGNFVMGLVSRGALCTSLLPHPQLTWSVGSEMSLEEASTIPLAYTLSYYSLFVQVRLSSKDVVLVHNWSDGVSVAATALALESGCKVYIVISDLTSKITIMDIFPKFKEDNIILHSQDIPFYRTILERTNRRGVNIIFNCKCEQLMDLSQECASRNAKFVEIGNSDSLDLGLMKKSCSLYHVNVKDIFEESEDILGTVAKGVASIIRAENVIPLKYKVFDMDHVGDAINYAENFNTSKAIIKIRKNQIYGFRRTYFDDNKSYIIVGGLGGLGFHLVEWFIERGATKIVLNSRSTIRSGYHISQLQKWKKQGLTVAFNSSNTCTLDGAKVLLNFASSIAPVGGIFNAALHNVDKFMSDITPTDFIAVAEPKIFSAQNLDYLSRKMCKHLDYFVLFSSIASSVGNPIQGNYTFVNSAIERLCETRRADGLHGLAIAWGPLADVGILTRLKTNIQYLETKRQKLSSCLEVIDHCLQQSEPVVVSCIYQDDEDTTMPKKKSFAEIIGDLFGIKNINEIGDEKTLLDLGMDSLLSFEVQHLLMKECGVEKTLNEIKKMTFKTIIKY